MIEKILKKYKNFLKESLKANALKQFLVFIWIVLLAVISYSKWVVAIDCAVWLSIIILLGWLIPGLIIGFFNLTNKYAKSYYRIKFDPSKAKQRHFLDERSERSDSEIVRTYKFSVLFGFIILCGYIYALVWLLNMTLHP